MSLSIMHVHSYHIWDMFECFSFVDSLSAVRKVHCLVVRGVILPETTIPGLFSRISGFINQNHIFRQRSGSGLIRQPVYTPYVSL